MSCLFHLKPFYFNISVTWSSQSRSLSFNCTVLAAGCWGGTVLYENNLFLNENIHKCLTAISKIRPFLNSTCFSTFTHFSKNFSLTIVPLGVCPKIVEEHLLPSSTPEGWPKVKVSPSVCFGKKKKSKPWRSGVCLKAWQEMWPEFMTPVSLPSASHLGSETSGCGLQRC